MSRVAGMHSVQPVVKACTEHGRRHQEQRLKQNARGNRLWWRRRPLFRGPGGKALMREEYPFLIMDNLDGKSCSI